MSFDYDDYHKRQRNIRRITIGSLVIALLSFAIVGLSLIRDPNTQTLIEVLSLCSSLVFLAGLASSFNAWFEKKFVEYGEKIRRK